jgi:hypothetical protein
MPSTKDAEALALLLRAGIETADNALVARMVTAAEAMRAGLARQPRDLPAGLEPAAAFAVRP